MNKKLASIPYVEHKRRMYEAYERERKILICLISSNVIWLIIVLGLAFMR
jgi:hypothetical protein